MIPKPSFKPGQSVYWPTWTKGPMNINQPRVGHGKFIKFVRHGVVERARVTFDSPWGYTDVSLCRAYEKEDQARETARVAGKRDIESAQKHLTRLEEALALLDTLPLKTAIQV